MHFRISELWNKPAKLLLIIFMKPGNMCHVFPISQKVKCYSLQIPDWLTTRRNPEYTGTDIGLICFLNVTFSEKYLKMV